MTPIQIGLALGTAVVLLFIGLDAWDVRERRNAAGIEPARWSTVGFLSLISLLFAAIQVGLTLILPQAQAILAWAEQLLLEWRGASAVEPISWGRLLLLGGVTFYVSGLIDYLAHRFFNHSPLFWWTHEYHHLPREVFVIVPGLLLRPFAAFSTVAVMFGTVAFAHGVCWALGWPVYDLRGLFLFGAFNLLILLTSHSSFLRRWTWPHHLMRLAFLTTPHEHLMHHAIDRPGNYGNVTTLWDRLLGTYVNPLDPANQDLRLGLDYDQDFLGVLTLGRLKLSQSLRERFQLARYCRFEGQGVAPQEEGSTPNTPTPEACGDGAPAA